ncbi:ROK family glucokinase [Clostridium sp. AM58-1XD]|uniref:ROK family glucokinase n=1 Tax=Clostridium sp. AM58-1XD TaxID=2292307 RepID=UPI000E51ECC4|nr:ROK family glucokinase [Clostridium sp. AM58-1XD]RGY97700.1 ROK family protein [Clostridium sp. AM58-1XD]
MEKKCIGIDIGGTSVKLGLFSTDGTLLEKWEIPTRKENGGDRILPDIADSIKAKMKEKGLTNDDLAGAGMGYPGPVLPDGYVEVCVNIGWHDRNPEKELSSLLDGLFVRSGNDANVAALGEMWQGGGRGYRDLVAVTLGTGVGGGVILNEQIVAGRHGTAGEIGHIHVRDEETEQCNCGGVGCLEQVASATGIAREARRMMKKSDLPSVLRKFGDNVTAKDVLDAAKEGDKLADEVVETSCRYLGLVLAQVAMTIDPERFVIGGGVSKAGQFLIDRIWKYFDFYTPITKHKASIGLAELGNDAGIYGAARLIVTNI